MSIETAPCVLLMLFSARPFPQRSGLMVPRERTMCHWHTLDRGRTALCAPWLCRAESRGLCTNQRHAHVPCASRKNRYLARDIHHSYIGLDPPSTGRTASRTADHRRTPAPSTLSAQAQAGA